MNTLARLFVTLSLIVGNAQIMFASQASEAFESIKRLAGTWNVASDGNAAASATYEVVSGGSTVIERAHGMVTTYFVNDDELMAVHYCAAGNQPHLKMTNDSTANHITFEVVSVGGLHSLHGGHMAKLSLIFDGVDRLRQEWTWREDQIDDAPMVFNFSRN